MEKRELVWRKASHSGTNGGGCVEVADDGALVLVRDSKLGDASPRLAFDRVEWARFLVDLGR